MLQPELMGQAVESVISASRYHDICVGHRVYGQGGKCEHLHGHNYRIHFKVVGDLDTVGRVLDFSVIKAKLCMWLENNWDHKFLIWEEDPFAEVLASLDHNGVIETPFNPTAENMAEFLLSYIGPSQLMGLGVKLVSVKIEETAKCSAEVEAI